MPEVEWLPPRAPGAGTPPRYEPRAGEPLSPPARPWRAPARRRKPARDVAAPEPASSRPDAAPPAARAPKPRDAPPKPLPLRDPDPPSPPRPTFVGGRPSSAGTKLALAAGITSLAVLVLTLGVAALPCALMSAVAGWVAQRERRRQGRSGLGPEGWIAAIGIGAACTAMIVWALLAANGFEPADLERELREIQRELQQQRPSPRG